MRTAITVVRDGQPVLVDLDEMIAAAVKAAMPRGKIATDGVELKNAKPLGDGVTYRVEGDKLILVADLSDTAWRTAKPTKGKQNLLLASSRGMPYIPDSPIPKTRIALNIITEEEPA